MGIALDDLGLEHLWVAYPGREEYALADRISAVPMSSVPALCGSLLDR